MTKNEELLVVTEADRDAAADYWSLSAMPEEWVEEMRRGMHDTDPDSCSRAFARHRTRHEEALKEALKLALGRLIIFEPGDSRTVSDEFVAMACVLEGDVRPEVMEIIHKANEGTTRIDSLLAEKEQG